MRNKNKIRNNIVYCIEKYQITILATEFGVGIFELPQVNEYNFYTQMHLLQYLGKSLTFNLRNKLFNSTTGRRNLKK